MSLPTVAGDDRLRKLRFAPDVAVHSPFAAGVRMAQLTTLSPSSVQFRCSVVRTRLAGLFNG
jgi:hypothetical protein